MIIAATKHCDVRKTAKAHTSKPSPAAAKTSAPQIFIPTVAARRILLRDWWHKECKEGGFLHEYIRREKGRMPAQIRQVARLMANFKQNPKSDFRLIASVPARLYQRLKAEDPDFFSDNQNLRNLRRDNPDVVVKL
jgi:hypothetical protein